MKNVFRFAMAVSLVTIGYMAGRLSGRDAVVNAQGARVFELRTYTTNDGKLDALNARFKNHTVALFTKHGMTNIGYWTPVDPPRSQNTLIYILAHPSLEAAKKSWAAFREDPVWQKARAESEAQGAIVKQGGVESVFLNATDYSPIK
jgi:hypothetical protein